MDWPVVPEGFRLGVLMLETRFPRPVGDIGNPHTFPFPVDYKIIPGALVERIVTPDALPEPLVERFAEAARGLVSRGAGAISTSCGFLSPLQERLASEIEVPVATSSLHLLPQLCRQHGPDAHFGVLTFDSTRLDQHHLPITRCRIHIEGIEVGNELHRVVADDLPHLDTARAKADAVAATARLMKANPGIKAIILECTNLAPYRDAVAHAARCSVLDIRDAIAASLRK